VLIYLEKTSYFVLLKQEGKIIKKLSKIVLIFFLVVFTLPTVSYVLIRQQKVQNYLVHRITTKLSNFLGTSVTISSVGIDLFSNINLRNFCVLSPQCDTILYTPNLEINLNTVSWSSRFLEFKKVTMTKPDIHFYVDSTGTINFQFIINKLESKDTTSTASHPLVVSIREIILKDANFTLKSFYHVSREYGINFTDLHLSPLQIRATDFRIDHGVSMHIRNLSARDHSGFALNKLSARFKINKETMLFNDLTLRTSQSDINADHVQFRFHNPKELKTGVFGKTVKIDINLQSSDISSDDIAWFLPVLKEYHISANASGTFHGILSDLKGRDLDIHYGKRTRIKGNVDINGLPDIASSFMHINIKSLYTTPSDIESIKLPKKGLIKLPENFSHISYLSYHGKFTGFFNDFVAYGTISTNLGTIESDLSLKPDTSNYFNFNGRLKAIQFDLGTFFNKTDLFGKISLNAMISGSAGTLKNTRAQLNGIVNSFTINKYNYQNINVDGTFANNTYDGALSISDPNINLDFQGKVNLANEIPTFNFKANVKSAWLHKLNLDKKDTGSFVSFYATADVEGKNFDELQGEIKLWNSTLRKTGKEIHIDNFLMFTKTVNDTNRIILRSDLADAEVWGTYQFTELKHSFISLVRNYLPSVVANQPMVPGSATNNFKFEAELKNTRQVTDFFAPGLYISKDTKLSGTYDPFKNKLAFNMNVPLLQHGSKKWYNVYFNGQTLNHSFSFVSGCKDLKVNNQLDLQNFSVESEIKHDTVDMHLRWNNWDTVTYKGNLFVNATFTSEPDQALPTLKLGIKPSQIILKDTIWSIRSGEAVITRTGVSIDQFLISHLNQSVKINGTISSDKNQEQTLSAVFHQVDLGNLGTILNTKKLALDGIINGNVSVSNLYTNPIFHAALTIDSLAINNQPLGNTLVKAIYDNTEKQIKIEAQAERNAIKILNINGVYTTPTKELNFDIDVNKLKMDIFEPYISNVFSDVKGTATGSVQLTGNIGNPELNGSLKIQKASFVVNYLKTRYSFAHTIDIKKNTFLFKNVEVYDGQERASKAIVNGQIEYNKLKDLYSRITVEAANFKCLNTTEKDNLLFYGQGYATGKVLINTSPDEVTIDVKEATTDPNTVIYIPLTTKVGPVESNYIRIITKQVPVRPFEQYEIDKTNESKNTGPISAKFKFKCDLLRVTPDASIQIVFDQKIGDLIKGNGAGNLSMYLEGGVFNMYGTYTIAQGEYLFTLQNVVNKKFTVGQGGTIVWNGNPLDAIVNINAIYSLRASLYQLVGNYSTENSNSTTNKSQYQKMIPIECRLFLTDKLMTPTIRYDINFPNADQETRNLVNNFITNDEDESKQFLALLIANSFLPNSNSNVSSVSSGLGVSAARSTGLEFLSNQLSRMISQFSKDFDIGLNYHPGDQVTTGQAEMAISTQLLNDRLTINGNVDVGGNEIASTAKNTSNIVGEGNVEFKLTNNGKLRLRGFNRSNKGSVTELSEYTQGVGVFYREDFNSFGGLLKKYFKMIFGRKEKNTNKPVKDKETEDDTTASEE
jgi:hypothetical protein